LVSLDYATEIQVFVHLRGSMLAKDYCKLIFTNRLFLVDMTVLFIKVLCCY